MAKKVKRELRVLPEKGPQGPAGEKKARMPQA